MSEDRRWPTAAALAASALLHLAAALVARRGAVPGRRPVARPAEPIEVAIDETPPPGGGRRIQDASRRDSAPPARRRLERSSRSPAPAAPRTPPAPAAPPGPKPPEVPPPSVDLSFDALAGAAKARAAEVPSPAEDLERLLVPAPARAGARPSLADLRAQAERHADAVQNVRAGRADPLLFDYLRDARDRLTPAARRIAEALPLGPGETVRGWGRGYLGAVDDAHRGAFAPVKPADEPFGGPRPDVLGAYGEAERQAASGAEERVAEVCVGVAPDHAVVVTLRRSSGNAALDRLALDSFRAAGDRRAPPADIRPALACYRVRVSAHRVMPLPSVSFDFARRSFIYPLKRITDVSVELESVDFGSKPQTSPLLHTPQ